MRVFAAGLLFVCLLYPPSSHAQLQAPAGSLQALTSCVSSRFYSAQSPDAPPLVAASFAQTRVPIVIRVCRDLENNLHYFLREPDTVQTQAGICRVEEYEIFPGTMEDEFPVEHLDNGAIRSDSVHGWKWFPPADWLLRYYPRRTSEFALLTHQPCPRGDDATYIPVNHVTDGTLKSFDHLWRSVIASSRAFDRAFAHVEASSNAPEAPVDPKYISELKSEMFGAPGQPLLLYGMDCAKYSNDCDAFIGNKRHSYEIGFDVGDKGLVLTRLWALVAMI